MKKIVLPLVLALAVSFIGCKKAEVPAPDASVMQEPAPEVVASTDTVATPAAEQAK